MPHVLHSAAVVCLLLASGEAADPKPTDAEAAAIAAVGKLGGKAVVEATLDESARVSVTFEKGTDKALIQLVKAACVGAVEIRDTAKMTEVGFARLKELPHLQKLVLAGGTISGTEARSVSELGSLTVLSLGGCKIGDTELGHLKKLEHLKRLDLRDTQLTDKGLKPLLELSELEEVNLSGTAVTDAGVKSLLELKELKLLLVMNCKKTTNTGLAAIEDGLQQEKRKLIIRR